MITISSIECGPFSCVKFTWTYLTALSQAYYEQTVLECAYTATSASKHRGALSSGIFHNLKHTIAQMNQWMYIYI